MGSKDQNKSDSQEKARKKSTNSKSGSSAKKASGSPSSTAEAVINTVGQMNPRQRKILLFVILALVIICGIYLLLGDPLGLLSAYETISAQAEQAPQAHESPGGAQTSNAAATGVNGALDVYVIDVGQGDAIFLRSPSGKTMLVDSSTSSAWGNLSGFLEENNITKLDVVIATHPHEDHIGNMQKIITQHEIGAFYMPDATTTTRTFERMIDALEEREVDVFAAEAGNTIAWDDQVEIIILNPAAGKEYSNLNENSVVCRVKFGETAIMLTGDAEGEAEEDALHAIDPSYFPSTVLKAGHHGSRTSTSSAFLDAVNPSIFVISCGADNSYGHPHKETMEMLEERGIPWYRTDEQGTIHITFDGKTAKVETER